MDVTQAEVENVMHHHRVSLMIHGHTHRPNIHHFTMDGHEARRIVLGDWGDYGYVLRINEKSLSQDSFPID
ncbi:UDP-2,3-diacylglucosamine hydrolase [Vibrio astriarenae]|nr:UDP-2,3-diacylglucosamine hydrolase [Vibrio sp. C7]